MKNLFKLMPCTLLLFGLIAARADVVVVVSAKSTLKSLTKDQVSDIFLGHVPTYPDGSQAVPIDQVESAAERQEFHAKVTGKNVTQLKAYWARMIFSGKGIAPKEVPNSAEVKKLIAANPSMIGYISKELVDASVNVILAP